MAKITIIRKNSLGGCAVKHEVYLNNKFLGVLKNGRILDFDASVGTHILYFKSVSKLNKANAEFRLTVNKEREVIKILTGFDFSGKYIVKYADGLPHTPNYNFGDNKGVRCPSCGSTDLTIISETYTSGKDFNSSNACCGYFLCGPLGLLAGVDGKGKQQHTNNFWVCKKCGNKFRM